MVWRETKRLNITLPKTEEPDYKSLDALLHHAYRAARGYMVWICAKLELPDPEIKLTPVVEKIKNEADKHLIYLLEKWRIPLVELTEEVFNVQIF